MKKLFIISLFIFWTVSLHAVFTGGSAAAFLRAGAGARAAGMGNAFSAFYGDASLSYWNPAGITGISRTGVSSMFSWLTNDRSLNSLNFIYGTNAGHIGINLLNSSIGGIDIRESDTEIPDAVLTFNQNCYYLTYAKELYQGISAGINIKAVHMVLGEFNALGVSFDAGVHLRMFDEAWFSVVLQDPAGTLQWSTGTKEEIPFVLRLGSMASFFGGQLKLAVEAEQDEWEGIYIKTGAEGRFFEILYVRAGASYGLRNYFFTPSAGAGILYDFKGMKLQLDYALAKNEYFSFVDINHRISANVYF
ncbi:MAG: PorV/PorQ family protein [Candidatus Goldiibacteriota bacterium]